MVNCSTSAIYRLTNKKFVEQSLQSQFKHDRTRHNLYGYRQNEKFTSRSTSPMTPKTSPAAPTIPMDSPNNKAARTATVKGCESIMTCNNVMSKRNHKLP